MGRIAVAVLLVAALAITITQAAAEPTARGTGPAVQQIIEAQKGVAEIPTLPNGLMIPMPSGGTAQAVKESLLARASQVR
jgi:hypothetical protein